MIDIHLTDDGHFLSLQRKIIQHFFLRIYFPDLTFYNANTTLLQNTCPRMLAFLQRVKEIKLKTTTETEFFS